MRIVKEGDKKAVICHRCGTGEATYLLRDIDFSDRSGTVKNVLAAVCDSCQEVVSIPAQSTPKVQEAYQKTRIPLEVRVPAHYLDILHVATQKIAPNLDESFNRALILYYVHTLSLSTSNPPALKQLLAEDFAKARISKRVSLKITPLQNTEIETLMQQHNLQTSSEVVRAVILKIHDDLIVHNRPAPLAELRKVAAVLP